MGNKASRSRQKLEKNAHVSSEAHHTAFSSEVIQNSILSEKVKTKVLEEELPTNSVQRKGGICYGLFNCGDGTRLAKPPKIERAKKRSKNHKRKPKSRDQKIVTNAAQRECRSRYNWLNNITAADTVTAEDVLTERGYRPAETVAQRLEAAARRRDAMRMEGLAKLSEKEKNIYAAIERKKQFVQQRKDLCSSYRRNHGFLRPKNPIC